MTIFIQTQTNQLIKPSPFSRYNRQFRYEERDGKGYLKGRYGFFDKYGKLQVTNYSADPYEGFHAEGAAVPKYPH